jgi:hypothetical protein
MPKTSPPYFDENDIPHLLDGDDPDIRKEAEQVVGPDLGEDPEFPAWGPHTRAGDPR